ncbi:MAG: hypothetical protein AB7N71_11810, partial [Phycisphaerae bacterium]
FFETDGAMSAYARRVVRNQAGEISEIASIQEWEVFSSEALEQIAAPEAYRTAYLDARIGEN